MSRTHRHSLMTWLTWLNAFATRVVIAHWQPILWQCLQLPLVFSKLCSLISGYLQIRAVLFYIFQPFLIRYPSIPLGLFPYENIFLDLCSTHDQNTPACVSALTVLYPEVAWDIISVVCVCMYVSWASLPIHVVRQLTYHFWKWCGNHILLSYHFSGNIWHTSGSVTANYYNKHKQWKLNFEIGSVLPLPAVCLSVCDHQELLNLFFSYCLA